MKHITYADKSVLVGDHIADLLIEYAAALSSRGEADSVFVHAISSDGDEVEANFLLGPGAPMMSETTTSTIPEPDNAELVQSVQEKLDRLTATNHGTALADPGDDGEQVDFDPDAVAEVDEQ